MTRRAKIVCTIGPATATPERMSALIDAGMNVARMNFSHGTQADHESVYRMVRQAADEAGKPVAILADLQGPKIRLGRFAESKVEWNAGDRVFITSEDIEGTAERVSTTYKKLPSETRKGDRLLVDDGKLALEVLGVEGEDIECLVVEGGPVSDNKGLSLPNVAISVPALSEKDIADLKFALDLGVDLIAMSFVRSPEDVRFGHKIMDEVGVRRPIIAKIEKPEAVQRLREIVLAFDGIMVARGDLGVEMPLEEVPMVQKAAIQLSRENAKPVIVATQMLDSMIENARPTRAETSDVANAVLDGADAVMLSGETSVGRYPIATVRTMAQIVTRTEEGPFTPPSLEHAPRTKPGAVTAAAASLAEALGAKALVAFTQTGDTLRRMSRLKPDMPLYGFTPIESVRNQLSLSWGTSAYLVEYVDHTDAMFEQVDAAMRDNSLAETGDTVIIVAGSPPGTPGSTNTIRVHRIGGDE
ncbi:pyruvate kinase [Natronoglycomyces albus]|uniref:Pyruvate kinase n=1 Tax=Natronoglycomyces albus TaxID=2811108 RepID=A0A895XM00_9ACTN|nr:pyruvate kinase [Natronoglycomyces albus]QSB03995.1 pyruvate kinase [Natronoglycomyces albus]